MHSFPLIMIICLYASAAMLHGADAGRDPLKQPFARDSIWNHPIGSKADYVHAQLKRSLQFGVFVEEEMIVLSPTAPLTKIFENHADWHKGKDRSTIDGPLIASLPIPKHYTTASHIPGTPNAVAAILHPDGRTIHNSQPFTRAKAGGHATSHYVYPNSDLYGDGIAGAHGGSGLSGLGGTIRLGELVPGGRIPHALKIVMPSKWFHYRNDGSPGYRWPASKADGHASRWTYKGTIPAVEMGSLLALKPEFDLRSLKTEPGRIIAQACIDYGCYICDTSGWNAYYLAYEWSPAGRVMDEFKKVWGYELLMKDHKHPWAQDFGTIIEALHAIDNNSADNIGGGGTLRQALPPALTVP